MERCLATYLCAYMYLLFVIKPLHTLDKGFNTAQEQTILTILIEQKNPKQYTINTICTVCNSMSVHQIFF